MRTVRILLVTLVLAACAACGGGGSGGSGDGGGTDEATIAWIRNGLASREQVVAQQEGFFADEGLKVTVKNSGGDTALISTLASGEVDMGYVTYAAAFAALDAGIPLREVTGVQTIEPRIQTAWVARSSDLQDVKDLDGAKIGVSAVGGYGNILFGEALDSAGLSLDDVTLTEVAFPDMVPALERGDIDVAWLPAPFAAAERSNPASKSRQLLDFNDIESLQGLPQGGTASTEQFVKDSPDAVEAFRKAEQDGADYLEKDPDADRALQVKVGGFPPAVAAELPLQSYSGRFTAEELEPVVELLVKYGLLDKDNKVDLEAFTGGAT